MKTIQLPAPLPNMFSNEMIDVDQGFQKGAPMTPNPLSVGRNLENTDSFDFNNVTQRRALELILSQSYQMNLTVLPQEFVLSMSHTSRKVILENSLGERYVLKKKPLYCCDDQRLQMAADVQNRYAKETGLAPSILMVQESEPYISIGNDKYFLTSYVPGVLYNGSDCHTLSSFYALKRLHDLELDLEYDLLPLCSFEQPLTFLSILEERVHGCAIPYCEVIRDFIGCRLDHLRTEYDFSSPNCVIHSDPSPFNFIFDKNGRVVALNDFDNTCLGKIERDIAILVLTQCSINYAGTSSTMRTPFCELVDCQKARILCEIIARDYTSVNWTNLRIEIQLHWLELFMLGIVRGEFPLDRALENLQILDVLTEQYDELIV